MPSTVYKGDIAEISFGTEAGMRIIDSGTVDLSSTLSTIVIEGGAPGSPIVDGILQYPQGMLVGARLIIIKVTSAVADADLDKHFTIVKHAPSSGSTNTVLTITPNLASGAGAWGVGDGFEILPFTVPPLDTAMVFNDSAITSNESSLTDQFIGITSALTLPETKIDLKRFHVIGLGRDVSVQVPGRFVTEGGSFEVAMHTGRWLKYCLGNELCFGSTASGTTTSLAAATEAGQSHITVSNATGFAVGNYIRIRDTTVVPIVSDHEPDGGTWAGALSGTFDKAQSQEHRRILAVTGTIIHLDEPLSYPHNTVPVDLYDFSTSGTNPPALAIDGTGTITNPVKHLLFSRTHVPSFSLEASLRRRDVASSEGTADGTSTDSKELNRMYRGCKVTDFTLSTDTDAALKLSVNFNSALCYTDTGREGSSPKGSRYTAHRMFDDTASNDVDRYKSGIAKGSQKPFMFYNGSITLAGQTVAQVTDFTLTGSTGMQTHYNIQGSSIVTADTDEVPFAGSRNPSLLIEGQTTYEMTMGIIVDDPVFFHKMRTATEFSIGSNQILLTFIKNGTGSTRETLVIIIDDYFITEAPMQIPEDKGVIKSTLKVMPKAVKVICQDPIIKY